VFFRDPFFDGKKGRSASTKRVSGRVLRFPFFHLHLSLWRARGCVALEGVGEGRKVRDVPGWLVGDDGDYLSPSQQPCVVSSPILERERIAPLLKASQTPISPLHECSPGLFNQKNAYTFLLGRH